MYEASFTSNNSKMGGGHSQRIYTRQALELLWEEIPIATATATAGETPPTAAVRAAATITASPAAAEAAILQSIPVGRTSSTYTNSERQHT